MPRKILEGCQWGSAVPRTVLAPLTGPQIMVIGIYFHRGLLTRPQTLNSLYVEAGDFLHEFQR